MASFQSVCASGVSLRRYASQCNDWSGCTVKSLSFLRRVQHQNSRADTKCSNEKWKMDHKRYSWVTLSLSLSPSMQARKARKLPRKLPARPKFFSIQNISPAYTCIFTSKSRLGGLTISSQHAPADHVSSQNQQQLLFYKWTSKVMALLTLLLAQVHTHTHTHTQTKMRLVWPMDSPTVVTIHNLISLNILRIPGPQLGLQYLMLYLEHCYKLARKFCAWE